MTKEIEGIDDPAVLIDDCLTRYAEAGKELFNRFVKDKEEYGY